MNGSGDPRSPYAVAYGKNGYAGDEGIRALDVQEALAYAELHLSATVIEEHFGDLISEA